MDTRVAASEEVRRFVASGFYDADQIVRMVDESLFRPGEVPKSWLRAEVGKAFQAKRAEQANWPAVTDCDRLDQVFAGLQAQRIIALQNAGYEQSDGITEVTQYYQDCGGQKSDIVGYCFYHWQDLEKAMQYGQLWLTYGDILGDETKGVEVGQRIRRALEASGFSVEWNGSIETRLLIKAIKWQRRT